MDLLSEDLLTVWLRLNSTINNQRLVTGLSFNEAVVCNLLLRAQKQGRSLTASELCVQTRILKSQMNSILLSLEKRGAIQRCKSHQDRRRIELKLLPEGLRDYSASHARILSMVDRLIDSMGEKQVRQLIPLLHQVVDTFDSIQQEV